MRLFLALLLLQPLSQAQLPDPRVAAIQRQLDTFAQRMHDKQEDAILASYTRDAVFIDPSGKRFSTPAQLHALYSQVFATYDSDLHFGPPTVVMHGHSFHATGSFTEDLRLRKTGEVQHIHGTYRFNLATFYDGHWGFTRMQWQMAP